jgi:hypothetical protein
VKRGKSLTLPRKQSQGNIPPWSHPSLDRGNQGEQGKKNAKGTSLPLALTPGNVGSARWRAGQPRAKGGSHRGCDGKKKGAGGKPAL